MLDTLTKTDREALASIAEEMRIRKTKEVFLLFSLGSQFDHLIKQSLGKLGVFCQVADPSSITAEDVKKIKPIGIVLSGGPASVYEEAPPFDEAIFDLDIPVLGICLGFQLWAHHLEGSVVAGENREFGTHALKIFDPSSLLFVGCEEGMDVLESHGDIVTTNGLIKIDAATEHAPIAAGHYQHLWGVQFHPEVTETTMGEQIFSNFCFNICGAKDRYPASEVAKKKIAWLSEKLAVGDALLALSGGSDSCTAAYLLKEARKISGSTKKIYATYIRGIDRPDDEEFVKRYFEDQNWIELSIIDATGQFLEALGGKFTMEEKRIAMRGVYKKVLEEEAVRVGATFIVQGTLYTDISESGGGYQVGAKKAQIKLHHNVNLGFALEELCPLDDCVKDSGRNIGREVGVPEELLVRHPFPGPGMVVRIEDEITTDKLAIVRRADGIFIEELRKWDLYDTVWQAGAVVTQSITTCTKGDDAVSGIVVALWAVWSVNGFTARAASLPYDFLKHVSRRITNEIRPVGSVVYRISDKPPTTIEWG